MSISKVAVLGLDVMGQGIAQTFAMTGCDVTVFDEATAARDSLHDRVRQDLRDLVAAELISTDQIDATLRRIRMCSTQADAVRNAEFVMEGMREDLPAKQDLLESLERDVADDTILATKSSTIPISQSGVRLKRPERAVVTHWFNPPHIVPTVEVAGGPRTSERTIQATLDLLRRSGKLAIRINHELPGLLVNRVQMAMIREIWDLLDRGVASVEDIDAAIRGSMGFRLAALGPLQIQDLGGLPFQTAAYRKLAPDIACGTTVPPAVQRLVDAGHHGLSTGQGFYRYSPESAKQVRSDRDQRYLLLLKLLYQRPSGKEEP
jgi:3-hydroxybutyryl-CoA dehydrogenase